MLEKMLSWACAGALVLAATGAPMLAARPAKPATVDWASIGRGIDESGKGGRNKQQHQTNQQHIRETHGHVLKNGKTERIEKKNKKCVGGVSCASYEGDTLRPILFQTRAMDTIENR